MWSVREAEGDKVTEILAPFLTFTVNDPILIWIKLLAFNVCKKKKKISMWSVLCAKWSPRS